MQGRKLEGVEGMEKGLSGLGGRSNQEESSAPIPISIKSLSC